MRQFFQRIRNAVGLINGQRKSTIGYAEESEELVRLAYHLLLGRPPENDKVVREQAASHPNRHAIIASFLGSEEFRQSNPLKIPAMTGFEEPLEISMEAVGSPRFAELYEIVRRRWEELGDEDPHWSVMTSSQFRRDRFEEHRDAFYTSGAYDTNRFLAALRRAGIELGSSSTGLEFGCGVGRVTAWLAPHFQTLTAVDISQPHLDAATEWLRSRGDHHVSCALVRSLEEIAGLPSVDVVYSLIVLQHNPPPIARAILVALLDRLRPGGVGYFQIVTYIHDYTFDPAVYVKASARPEIEMHALPQPEVFAAVEEADCQVLEVLEDSAMGGRSQEISNVFLVRRR